MFEKRKPGFFKKIIFVNLYQGSSICENKFNKYANNYIC